jgi:2-aminobenzoate-CoA ligase
MHFHRDVLAVCDAFPRYLKMVEPDDVFCGTPPFAFTFGLGAQLLFPLRFGASTRLLRGPLDTDGLLAAIEQYRPTCLYTAPTMYRRLAAKADHYDLSSLRRCVSAGEALPAAVWEAFHGATGVRVVDGLGSTEMLHIFVSAPPDEARPGFMGRAVPGYEAEIVDEEGESVAPGTPGLLRVRGVTGCRYFDDPARQADYVRQGWNYTGDVCQADESGFIAYVSRVDDMIVSSGYKISGPEVEEALLSHPMVSECAVVGKPDAERTMLVHAFVVLKDGAAPTEETVRVLQDHVKKRIAPYKYPRKVSFVRDLPRTATGKLQRSALRKSQQEEGGQR